MTLNILLVAGVLSISCADKFNPLSNRHTPDSEYRMPLIFSMLLFPLLRVSFSIHELV